MSMAGEEELPLISGVEYTILFTDETLRYVGDPINDWETIDATLRRNEPGSGLFTIPCYPEVEAELLPGRRVVIVRTLGPEYNNYTHVLMSGPVEDWLKEQSDDGENAGIGKLTVHFADDLALIAARNAYPNPAQTAEAQTVDQWTMTGVASTVLYSLVNGNAGPGALASRRLPKLVLAADAGIGSNVAVKAQRMEPIGDVMRGIADTGGDLGFRTYQTINATTGANEIRFEVYLSPDKTKTVFFGFGMGNMKYRSVEVKAPTCTTATVGGQGEGADRNLLDRTNTVDENAWGRFEQLVSRPGNNPVQELQDDGDKALAAGAATTRVTANVSDVPSQRFGLSYQVGDRVSVEISDGKFLSGAINTVHVQAWNGAGEYISPTAGSQAALTAPIWTQRLREIEDRVARVERSVKPAVPPPA